eukprot:g419.t1
MLRPIHVASEAGWADVITVLVQEGGADVDVMDDGGNSPALLAAQAGQKEALAALQKAGADLVTSSMPMHGYDDGDEDDLLHHRDAGEGGGGSGGRDSMLFRVVEVDPLDVRPEEPEDVSQDSNSLYSNDDDEYGDERGGDGNNSGGGGGGKNSGRLLFHEGEQAEYLLTVPLVAAAYAGHAGAVEVLLGSYALRVQESPTSVGSFLGEERGGAAEARGAIDAAVRAACGRGHIAVVEAILDHETAGKLVDLDSPSEEDGSTPLLLAVKWYCDRHRRASGEDGEGKDGCDGDGDDHDDEGMKAGLLMNSKVVRKVSTPLFTADSDDDDEDGEEVDDTKKKNNNKNKHEQEEEEVEEDGLVLLFKLVTYGADVDVADDSGLTPLHVTCKRGNTAACKLLLDAGADTDRAEKNGPGGDSLVIVAANGGHDDVIALLLSHATADVQDSTDEDEDEQQRKKKSGAGGAGGAGTAGTAKKKGESLGSSNSSSGSRQTPARSKSAGARGASGNKHDEGCLRTRVSAPATAGAGSGSAGKKPCASTKPGIMGRVATWFGYCSGTVPAKSSSKR